VPGTSFLLLRAQLTHLQSTHYFFVLNCHVDIFDCTFDYCTVCICKYKNLSIIKILIEKGNAHFEMDQIEIRFYNLVDSDFVIKELQSKYSLHKTALF
jgi:hypothetical protein